MKYTWMFIFQLLVSLGIQQEVITKIVLSTKKKTSYISQLQASYSLFIVSISVKISNVIKKHL